MRQNEALSAVFDIRMSLLDQLPEQYDMISW